MSTFSAILAAILGIVFVAVSVPKITGRQRVVDEFERWGYPDTIRTTTGALELLSGVLLLVGLAVPALAITGALLLIPVMLGALATHQRAGDPIAMWLPPVVLLVLTLTLAISMLPD